MCDIGEHLSGRFGGADCLTTRPTHGAHLAESYLHNQLNRLLFNQRRATHTNLAAFLIHCPAGWYDDRPDAYD